VGKPPLRLIVCRATVNHRVKFEVGLAAGEVSSSGSPPRLYAGTGCRRGVEILELQPAGKKRMSAVEFLRGHPPRPGDRLGPETP
jgi:methionyl-tRNA formyltransferase